MECNLITLTNTGTTLVNFNYQRCSDYMWEYQVDLFPNQPKNIWAVKDSVQITDYYKNNVSFDDIVVFPLTPSSTPLPTLTPTITPTPTPTQPVVTFELGFSSVSALEACQNAQISLTTYYCEPGTSSIFFGVQMYTDISLSTLVSSGYYHDGGTTYYVFNSSNCIGNGSQSC